MKNLLIITQKVDENDQLLGFFIDWISRFAKRFDKITAICLKRGEFNLPSNVRVLSLGKDVGAGKLKQLFNFYYLIFSLRSDYDAVFVHMNPIWMVLGGWCWGLLRKTRFLWYTSGGVTIKLKLAEKFSDNIFTASPESFRLPSKKVIVTGHGIDTDLFKPSADLKLEKFSILSTGRIAEVKNYEILIRAAKILKDKNIEFSVTIVGEPALERDRDYEKKLKLLIGDLGLREEFSFLGKINHKDLVAYYQSHHLFIHLSKTGSLDKALLEAMSCGMKVLSSSDSAKVFLSQEFIFSENDSSDLAEKIQYIKNKEDDLLLREYVIRNHNLDNLVNKLSNFINER